MQYLDRCLHCDRLFSDPCGCVACLYERMEGVKNGRTKHEEGGTGIRPRLSRIEHQGR